MAQPQSTPLRAFLANLIDQSSLRVAVMGDVIGDRPNYQNGNMGASDGEAAEIHTSVVAPANGDVVYVGYQDPLRPAGTRVVFWLRNGSDPTLPAPLVGM